MNSFNNLHCILYLPCSLSLVEKNYAFTLVMLLTLPFFIEIMVLYEIIATSVLFISLTYISETTPLFLSRSFVVEDCLGKGKFQRLWFYSIENKLSWKLY